MNAPDLTSNLNDELTIVYNSIVMMRALVRGRDDMDVFLDLLLQAQDSLLRCKDLIDWEQARTKLLKAQSVSAGR